MLCTDLESWLADLAERHKPATVRFYRNRSRWIREAFGTCGWADLTPPQVLHALDQANRWGHGRRKAPDTQRANSIAWEQFQRWAVDTGRLSAPILPRLKKPAGRRRELLPTPEDIRRILARASPAFAAIYQALLFTGARPGELCAAQVKDLDRTRRVITCRKHKTAAKTGRPRFIPLSHACLQVIDEHLAGRQTGPLFLTPRGRPWTVARLSQTFRALRSRCLIDRRVVLYSTRHLLATQLCRAKGIAAAAGVLGHTGLQTIARYVHHDPQELVGYVDALDPHTLAPESHPPRD